MAARIYRSPFTTSDKREFSSVRLKVTPQSDSIVEGSETIILNILQPSPTFHFAWDTEELVYQSALTTPYLPFFDFHTTPSGTGTITIEDDDGQYGESGYSFSAEPQSEFEYAIAQSDMAKFVIAPIHYCVSDQLFVHIKSWIENSASS